MSVRIIEERLKAYNCRNIQEEDQALREITQEIALMSLARNHFFKYAAFHGGTCLRILHGMNRFSEDMDFILLKPDPNFQWESFVKNMSLEFQTYGYEVQVAGKSDLDAAVKKVFFKDDSIGNFLQLYTSDPKGRKKQIKIRLEIDTRPPAGSVWTTGYVDFPLTFSVTTQDPSSEFALKNHALLCRPYVKGRDWYDFIWCIGRKFPINFELLSNAMNQMGPWERQGLKITKERYFNEMDNKIRQMDWQKAKEDVQRFLKEADLSGLELWNTDFFLHYLYKLMNYL